MDGEDAMRPAEGGVPMRARLAGSTLGSFTAAWWSDPIGVGALVPSGNALAARIARFAAAHQRGVVVELGPGTGAITGALLAAGVAPHRLCLVERNPRLASFLRRRFAGLRLIEGDAARLQTLAARHGIAEAAVVISGLPLRFLSPRRQWPILVQAFALLEETGSFLQFTYSHRSPISAPLQRRLGIVGTRLGTVWQNLPPSSIWQYRRRLPVGIADRDGGMAARRVRHDR